MQTDETDWQSKLDERGRELKQQGGKRERGELHTETENAGERWHYDIEQIVLILLSLQPSSISAPIPQPDTFLS